MSQPTLIVGESLNDLIGPLADRLSEPLVDPLASELVTVANLGVRQWTTRELARRLGASRGGDGIVANVEFPFPDGLLTRLLGAPDHDPWALSNLVWVVLDELQWGASDAALGPAGRVAPGTKRGAQVPQPSSGTWYGRARHLADLFDRYGRHRPELIRQWADGNDVDGRGHPLPKNPRSGASQLWQCELWRRVRAHIGQPSPAERLGTRLEDLEATLDSTDLPARLTLFGLSALPPVWFSLLDGLANRADVAVFWLTPSVDLWQQHLHAGRGAPLDAWLPKRPRISRLGGDQGLLHRWSRPAQEAARLWGGSALGAAPGVDAGRPVSQSEDTPGAAPPTLLGRIQRVLRTNSSIELGSTDIRGDGTLVIHRAHGPTRQVEVLRTAVAHALSDDPTLSLADVLIVCPDVDTYGPLAAAAFAPGSADPTTSALEADPGSGAHTDGLPPFPIWSAVRSPGTDHPIAQAMLGLLDLLDGRGTVGEVLDLIALAPVALRFGLSDSDIDDLTEWAQRAGIRWGLDGQHRSAQGVPVTFTAATWAAGVDRLLVGASTTSDESIIGLGGVAPVDVEGTTVGLVARLAAIIGQLRQLVTDARSTGVAPAGGQRLSSWVDWSGRALDLLTAEQPSNDWQRRHLIDILADLRPRSDRPTAGQTTGTTDPLLTVDEFRASVSETMSGIRRRGGPAEGAVTLGPLQALRSVPARVICLLGIDADILGSGASDADDLLAAAPALGDRDPRADGRQLLLEELLAAGDRLIVTTTGRDQSTNAPVPLPVVLAELLEELGIDVDDASAHHGIVVDHPRHDFDVANFRPETLGVSGPWSFNPVGLAEARARSGPIATRATMPFLAAPLPNSTTDNDGAAIGLDQLIRFIGSPPTEFLRESLGVTLPRDEELGDELHPIELDGLEKYQLREELLASAWGAHERDLAVRRWSDVQRSTGALPPGQLGETVLTDTSDFVDQLIETCAKAGVDRPGTTSVTIEIDLPSGRSIQGVVDQVDDDRPGPIRVGARTLKPKHELTHWVELMALAACDPSRNWSGVAVGRKNNKIISLLHELRGEDAAERAERATAALDLVVELYVLNRSEPLPLWPNTGAEMIGHNRLGTNHWETMIDGGKVLGDRVDAATQEIWGDLSLNEYRDLPARSDDPGDTTELRRPIRLAQALWNAVDASVTRTIDGKAAR